MKQLVMCIFLYALAFCEVSGLDERIVGGRQALVGQFPFIASLEIYHQHVCGGAIVSSQYIVTAAHCLGYHIGTVTVGTLSLKKLGTRYKVDEQVTHPRFNHNSARNDIGLVKIKENIRFTPLVQPIKLQTYPLLKNQRCILSGWGRPASNKKSSSTLKYLVTRAMDTSTCKQLRNTHGFRVTQNNVCTANGKGKGACAGDSGGPLVANGRLIGIVSWGGRCASKLPDVYTKVSSYIKWINSVVL